jgi:signal transduction histidine kinase
VRYPSLDAPVTVVVAGPAKELQREIDRFDRLLLLALGGLGIGLALVVGVQVGYGLRPLRRLARDLEDVRAGRAARLDVAAPREIETLVGAMNDVLERDADRIERARTHVGNLAHALKTPLSILAAEAARSGPDLGDRIARPIGEMTMLVEHHLTRAAAAGSRRVPGKRTDASDVVQALAGMLKRLHAEKGLEIAVDVAPAAIFAGERQDLEEMLGNLADNACKWAASRVLVAVRRDRESLVVEIDDDGPGLDPEAAAQALGRGVRLDQAEPGTGLGLSISADLAELYGGTLSLERGRWGGLRARLTLPAA